MKLVSCISPCYNVAPYIGVFLDSLIAQTYKRLEVILVDDESTDDTPKIIESYIPRLEEEGYIVKFVRQKNQGQSGAINNALKLVTGDFLIWPDPDDWLSADSVEKRLMFMLKHPEVALVRGNVERINNEDGSSLGIYESTEGVPWKIENHLEKLVDAKTWWAPQSYMARMSMFDTVVPGRAIYHDKNCGQNAQLVYPIISKYDSWQMPDVMGYYRLRRDSHMMGAVYASKLSYLRRIKLNEVAHIATLKAIKVDRRVMKLCRRFHKRWILRVYKDGLKESKTVGYGWQLYRTAASRAKSVREWLTLTRLFISRILLRKLKGKLK